MYSQHTIVQILNTCTTAPETLQYSLNTPERLSGKPNQFTNKNVLERQQQQTPLSYNAFSAAQNFQGSANPDEDLDGLIAQAMKLEPGLETCCDDFGSIIGGDFWGYGNILSGLDTNSSISRTLSCPQAVSAANKGKETVKPEKQSSSFKKRKADKTFNLKDATEDDNNDKKLKGCTEVRDSMSKETSDISKEKSKTSEIQKTDYIHVRARRGQATDSHSLAERVRREKISERMKYLQDLVPGCNSITGKAGMLDEIINYVQSLQRQVEFLSMKLAAVNPGPDFSDDNYYTKEVFPVSNSEFHHLIEELPEICLPPNYQSDVLHQAVSSTGLGIGVVPPMALRRTISAPVSIPGTVFESPCFSYLQSCSTWDAELQGIFGLEYQQARSTLPYQLRTGFSAGGHVRM